MLNIVGAGMRPNGMEQNTDDMDGQKTGEMALKYPGVIVGVKSAHYVGPEWKPYEQAEIAGKMANIPVMIDFGARRIERPIYKLFEDFLRPGDIYTHALSGERGEQDNVIGGVGRGMREASSMKGIYFDVGHGQASFAWSVAIPLLRAGSPPASTSSGSAYGQHERGDEGDAEHWGQVPGDRLADEGCDRGDDVASRA